jgi:hypothetical protein
LPLAAAASGTQSLICSWPSAGSWSCWSAIIPIPANIDLAAEYEGMRITSQ